MLRLFALLSITLAACAPQAPGSNDLRTRDENNVFGWDNRIQEPAADKGFKNIVYIPSSRCTGAFVWKNLVLTASHCITSMVKADGDHALNGDYTVQIGRQGDHFDRELHVKELWWGTLDADHGGRAKDWAIIRVDGNSDNYFDFEETVPANSNLNFDVTLAGYSADLDLDGKPVLSGVNKCKIRQHSADETLLYHDCDMTRGASGAPIWKLNSSKFSVVGLNVAEERDGGTSSLKVADTDWTKHRNVAINASQFAAKITELRAAFADGEK